MFLLKHYLTIVQDFKHDFQHFKESVTHANRPTNGRTHLKTDPSYILAFFILFRKNCVMRAAFKRNRGRNDESPSKENGGQNKGQRHRLADERNCHREGRSRYPLLAGGKAGPLREIHRAAIADFSSERK